MIHVLKKKKTRRGEGTGLSIRWRITLYYAVVLLIITLLAEISMFAVSEIHVNREAQRSVTGAVQESFDGISLDGDTIQIEENFDLYRAGTILILYDQEEQRILGDGPHIRGSEPLVNADLRTYRTPEETWLVYDLYRSYSDTQGIWIRGIYSMNAAASERSLQLSALIIGLPALIALSLFFGSLLAKRALQPAKQMSASLREINTGRDLKKRLTADHREDELGELAHTMNEMLDRLEASFAYEQRFSQNVSHDLKTPLSVILSECELALEETDDPSLRDAFLQIRQQANRILSMCNQLLEQYRHMSDKGTMEKEWFDLSLLCRSLTDDMRETAVRSDVTLLDEITDGLSFFGDETLIIRLLTNLIENAIKYRSPDHSAYVRVRLSQSAQADERKIFLEVSDNGIGIRPEDQEKIFDRFFKAEQSRKDQDSAAGAGFGLGLAFAKWIVEAHHGLLQVRSAPGQGSAFLCIFPG